MATQVAVKRTGAGVTRPDTVRALVITVSEVLCIFGTMVGVGVFGGTPVAQAAGGALSAEATRIAPAVPAFSIWSVIYVGLAVYTVLQWLPGRRATARHRSVGYLVAASMLLNAAWLLVVQADWIWVSVVVILALVAVLGVIVRRLATTPAEGTVDRIVTDGTFGLYVGWVSVATCANITAALVDSGLDVAAPAADVWSAVVLVVAGAVGVVLALRTGGNLGAGAAMVWGISWIAVARLSGAPASTSTAVVAIAVAALIAVITLWRFWADRQTVARTASLTSAAA